MIEIDGAQKSGSGTIVRDAIPFSALIGEELHLTRIRAKREKPGLRPQHLKAIQAAALVCEGKIDGGVVGSREVRFAPGGAIRGGEYRFDIGSAGSTTMLALALLPLALFAAAPSVYHLTGGLFQDFAPSALHLQEVLLPILRTMGMVIEMKILQPGYVPRGQGRIRLEVRPIEGTLRPLTLPDRGDEFEVQGISLSSLLSRRRVSERMASEFQRCLDPGVKAGIRILIDEPDHPAYEKVSVQAGAALAVWARTSSGCLIGSDMAGAPRRTAEAIGRRTALRLLADLDTGASVDRYVADQLIPFAALAQGVTTYRFPRMTDHIDARIWLVRTLLGAEAEVQGNLLTIRGIGYRRKR